MTQPRVGPLARPEDDCQGITGPTSAAIDITLRARQAGPLSRQGQTAPGQIALSQYELYAETAVIPLSLSLPARHLPAVLPPLQMEHPQ